MMQIDQPLTPEEAGRLADSIAERVVGLNLTVPAILFLEMHRPLARLASQAVVVMSPVLAPAFGLEGVQNFTRLFYHPGGVDLLLERIEALEDSKGEAAA